ncbi:MAG: hypothetical protein AB7I19_10625 [Planctomycetota bacterium]
MGSNFTIRPHDATTSPPGCAPHILFDFNISVLFQQGSAALPPTMPDLPRLIGGSVFCERIVLAATAEPARRQRL